METNYIQFPKELRDELALIYEFKKKYYKLKKQYDKLVEVKSDFISLKVIITQISNLRFTYPNYDHPMINKLSNFNLKYSEEYNELKKTFLKYNDKIPENAENSMENFENCKDIYYNLIDAWFKNYRDKLLKFFDIKDINKGD
jgi:hypothetical protein